MSVTKEQPLNRKWIVLQQPTGFPVLGQDIAFVSEPIPQIGDNQILVRVSWMSLDPYMRGTMNEVSYGGKQSYPRVMVAGGVGLVVESKNSSFSVGDIVGGGFGWQDYAVSNGDKVYKIEKGEFPLSYYLGVLGMPGATAYFGFLEICTPKPGETVVVSAATGAVGQLVGQIAKIKGCNVIGFASSDDKCKWAVEIGYNACINYRNKTEQQLTAELASCAPNGIHCYFDNTGGICTEVVFPLLAVGGRVSVCGQIAYYNAKETPKTAPMTLFCLRKQLKVEGFIVSQRWDQTKEWPACHAQMAQWIRDKKLVVREEVVEGLENAFDNFLTLFQDSPVVGGKQKSVNFGKLVVKLC